MSRQLKSLSSIALSSLLALGVWASGGYASADPPSVVLAAAQTGATAQQKVQQPPSQKELTTQTPVQLPPHLPPHPPAPPPPPPLSVLLKNPTSTPQVLTLTYSKSGCTVQKVTLQTRSSRQINLCARSASVRFDGNPTSAPKSSIGNAPCYMVARYANPTRFALTACP